MVVGLRETRRGEGDGERRFNLYIIVHYAFHASCSLGVRVAPGSAKDVSCGRLVEFAKRAAGVTSSGPNVLERV